MLAYVLLTTALLLVIAGPQLWDWYARRIDR